MIQTSNSYSLFYFIILVTLLMMYFLPIIIAYVRKNDNKLSIGVLNLLAGWTFIGWLISLIWALKNNASKEPIVINQTQEKSKEDHLDKLRKLKGLLLDGVITQEEFDKEKGKILNN